MDFKLIIYYLFINLEKYYYLGYILDYLCLFLFELKQIEEPRW